MAGRRVVMAGAVVWGLGCCLPRPVSADTCVQGVRPVTAGERAFHVATLEGVRAALPRLPLGWRVVEQTEVRAPRLACIGQERRPLAIEYSLRVIPPTVGALESAGERLGSGGEVPPGLPARMTVRVNPSDQLLDETAEPFELPHVALAFRQTLRGTDVGSVRLLLGDWWWDPEDPSEPRGRRRAHADFRTDVPHTRVQALAVELDGQRPQVDVLLAHLDLRALADLVVRGR